MAVNSLPKTVTRQRRGCDLNPGASAPESSTLTARLPSGTAQKKTEKSTKVNTIDYAEVSFSHWTNQWLGSSSCAAMQFDGCSSWVGQSTCSLKIGLF